MTPVKFTVRGVATAKGNMSAFPFKRKDGSLGAAVTEGTKGSGDWRKAIQWAAQQQCDGAFFGDVAVRLSIVFFLPRPKTLPKRVRHHLKKPDIDKLTRNVCDALKGVLWKDDSQVVDLVARKAYAVAQPYAVIRVEVADVFEERVAEQDLFSMLMEA